MYVRERGIFYYGDEKIDAGELIERG